MFKFLLTWGIIIGGALWSMNYLRDGQPTICMGRTQYVVDQIPYVMDILQDRHPLEIGLLRATLDQNGQLDEFAQAYVKQELNGNENINTSTIDCMEQSVMIHFDPDKVRALMADEIEKSLDN